MKVLNYLSFIYRAWIININIQVLDIPQVFPFKYNYFLFIYLRFRRGMRLIIISL